MTPATGTAEREAAVAMVEELADGKRITLAADKAYDTADFVAEMRRLGVTPHVSQNDKGRRSAIDGRTTRHPGYAVSLRVRKRIEEVFGWIKTVGGLRKTRHCGTALVGWMFTLAAVAYNVVRISKLLAAAAAHARSLSHGMFRPAGSAEIQKMPRKIAPSRRQNQKTRIFRGFFAACYGRVKSFGGCEPNGGEGWKGDLRTTKRSTQDGRT